MDLKTLYDQAADLPRDFLEAELDRLLRGLTAPQTFALYWEIGLRAAVVSAADARQRVRRRVLQRHDTAARVRLGLGE